MSKVVFKLSYKQPNIKSTLSDNKTHLVYIATREGVDKSISQKELEVEIDEDIQYNDVKKSHGLFNDIEDFVNLSDTLVEIGEKSLVWRGIISITEDDAIELGYEKKSKWMETVRRKMPDIASEMGIKLNNLRWVAALHQESGHPHIHFMIWESEEKKIRGIISKNRINKIRKGLTDYVFYEQRQNIILSKNLLREAILDCGQVAVKEAIQESQNTNIIKKLVPKLNKSPEIELAYMIKDLKSVLPKTGRCNFAFMNKEVKEKVSNISEYIMKQPSMSAKIAEIRNLSGDMAALYNKKAVENAKNNCVEDIKYRLSNIVLKSVSKMELTNNINNANIAYSVWQLVWLGLQQKHQEQSEQSETLKNELKKSNTLKKHKTKEIHYDQDLDL